METLFKLEQLQNTRLPIDVNDPGIVIDFSMTTRKSTVSYRDNCVGYLATPVLFLRTQDDTCHVL